MSRAQIKFVDAALNIHYIWQLSGPVWTQEESSRHRFLRRPLILVPTVPQVKLVQFGTEEAGGERHPSHW